MNYLIKICTVLLLTATTGNAYTQTTPAKPNIILILADDLGYHDVGYYGAAYIKTPHIDSLASGGIRLDQFYANSSVCSPIRASLLSGKYPDRVGVPGVIRTYPQDNWGYLKPGAKLLPQLLAENGYSTALVGKWHLGLESPNTPNEKGFHYFKGWLADMMDDYWDHKRHNINYMRLNKEVIKPEGHATDLFTDWAVSFIKQQKKSSKPFFLSLHYNAPHFPIQPPKEWLEKVTRRQPELSPKKAALVPLIEHMDDGIGKLLAALKEAALDDNTIVIFTSDNGGSLPHQSDNGPLRGGKQNMYEGGLRIPTVVRWFGKIPRGSASNHIGLSMDLTPTILEAAGVKNAKQAFDGESILPYLLSPQKQEKESRTLYFTRREGWEQYGGESIYAIRKGQWKLVQNSPFEPLELFNLDTDPQEKNNLRSQQPDIFKALHAQLMLHIQEAGKVPWQKN